MPRLCDNSVKNRFGRTKRRRRAGGSSWQKRCACTSIGRQGILLNGEKFEAAEEGNLLLHPCREEGNQKSRLTLSFIRPSVRPSDRHTMHFLFAQVSKLIPLVQTRSDMSYTYRAWVWGDLKMGLKYLTLECSRTHLSYSGLKNKDFFSDCLVNMRKNRLIYSRMFLFLIWALPDG